MRDIDTLIQELTKIAPKRCSKPKDEMCAKCKDRVYDEKAIIINAYLHKLTTLKSEDKTLEESLMVEVQKLLA